MPEATTTVTSREDEEGISLSTLVERFGEAPGQELFERIDDTQRRGDRVMVKTVREARQSIGAARASGHAQLVMPGGIVSGHSGESTDEPDGMVIIGLKDLEAVVKASNADFSWRAVFAPRRDLPVPTTRLVVRSGMPGRRMLQP